MAKFVNREIIKYDDLLYVMKGMPLTPRDGRPVAFIDDIKKTVYYPFCIDGINVVFYRDRKK